MQALELLSPARNLDIGIAAIDCGADAVYIAAGEFGARKDAGNPVEDIRTLCSYAHRFGARVFVTVNTIVYNDELDRVKNLVREIEKAGADALIVQDPAVMAMATIPVHASTQCSIREPDRARFFESLGCARLVLERQLSLEEIRAVRAATSVELEAFVHGALCVSYSGECYLSQCITGRSANRGECAQACRSLYDLVDDKGHVIVKNKALLSLKDFQLLDRLEDLAEAGIVSFKIEGRLKNRSYVANTVRAYSKALDELIERYPGRYCRASFGRVTGGFAPDTSKTFNRGFTSLYLDARRGEWMTAEAARGMGQPIGTVASMRPAGGGSVLLRITLAGPGISLRSGDGFSFVTPSGQVMGFRGDVCEGMTVRCKRTDGLGPGLRLYRNQDSAFERIIEAQAPQRALSVIMDVTTTGSSVTIEATREDGETLVRTFAAEGEAARDEARMTDILRSQLSKKTGILAFEVRNLFSSGIPHLGAAQINAMRRAVAEQFEAIPLRVRPLGKGKSGETAVSAPVTYKDNIANHTSEEILKRAGAPSVECAYELSGRKGAELMRSRYCIRYQLGMCLKDNPDLRRLFLLNNGRRFALGFDCKRCEMTVSEG